MSSNMKFFKIFVIFVNVYQLINCEYGYTDELHLNEFVIRVNNLHRNHLQQIELKYNLKFVKKLFANSNYYVFQKIASSNENISIPKDISHMKLVKKRSLDTD